MNICKARITQCSGRMYWYRAMVGKEVFVIRKHGDSDFGFQMIFVGAFDSTPSSGSYFNEKDLEIIEEFDGDIVERVTVEVVREVGAGTTALVGTQSLFTGEPGQYKGISDETARAFADAAKGILSGALAQALKMANA